MSKFSNKTLLLALLTLVVAVAGVKYLQSRKGERNFRSELVKIDSAKVSTVLIYPKSKKGEEVLLTKEGAQWKLRVSETKSSVVDSARMAGLLKSIIDLKPERLASRSTDKWQEFEVDTNGTRLVVKEGNKKTLEIIIGKYSFTGRQVETYARVAGDNETYTVNGFLDGTFNVGIDGFRDKTIVKGDKENWRKLSFALGDTARYFLEKREGEWYLDGTVQAGKDAVNNFLTGLTGLSAALFADDLSSASLNMPNSILEIDDAQGNKIKVEGFLIGERKVIRSSLNANDLFDGTGIWEKLFSPGSAFLPAVE